MNMETIKKSLIGVSASLLLASPFSSAEKIEYRPPLNKPSSSPIYWQEISLKHSEYCNYEFMQSVSDDYSSSKLSHWTKSFSSPVGTIFQARASVLGDYSNFLVRPVQAYSLSGEVNSFSPIIECDFVGYQGTSYDIADLWTASVKFVTNGQQRDVLTLEGFAQPSRTSTRPKVEAEVKYSIPTAISGTIFLQYMDDNGAWVNRASYDAHSVAGTSSYELRKQWKTVRISTDLPYMTIARLAFNVTQNDEVYDGNRVNFNGAPLLILGTRLFVETCVPDLLTGECL